MHTSLHYWKGLKWKIRFASSSYWQYCWPASAPCHCLVVTCICTLPLPGGHLHLHTAGNLPWLQAEGPRHLNTMQWPVYMYRSCEMGTLGLIVTRTLSMVIFYNRQSDRGQATSDPCTDYFRNWPFIHSWGQETLLLTFICIQSYCWPPACAVLGQSQHLHSHALSQHLCLQDQD